MGFNSVFKGLKIYCKGSMYSVLEDK